MKKYILGLVIMALTLSGIALVKAADEKASSDLTTISGEILDLNCYSAESAKGKDHMACARKCINKGGAPAGLLTADGTVYVLVGDHANPKPFAAAKKLAGTTAKLTGKIVKNGGLNAFVVEKTEKGK